MITTGTPETAAINPEHLIGTKWNTWQNVFGDRVSVEFVDHSHCIFTSLPKKYPLTYTIQEGKVYIRDIEGSFELRGDVLFNNDLPAFEKAA